MNHNQLKTIDNFIGRKFELERLRNFLALDRSAILIVSGRRRIGKSELIHQGLGGNVQTAVKVWKFEGLENQSVSRQRKAFLTQLSHYLTDLNVAKLNLSSWVEIFNFLSSRITDDDLVIYLEELQWMANYQNDLVSELKLTWDNSLRHHKRLKLILCGSATSFMANQVVYSKALYGRSINEINVRALSIQEVNEFFGPKFNQQAVLDYYLTFGAVPEYLSYLKDFGPTESPLIAIANQAFVPNGYFINEYEKIFVSSLAKSAKYKACIEAIYQDRFATISEIAKKLRIKKSGHLSNLLKDLERADFVERHQPYNLGENSKVLKFSIKDRFLIFYLEFIKPKLKQINNKEFINQPLSALNLLKYQQFLGYSFEMFCRNNSVLLANKLGIAGVAIQSGPYYRRGTLGSAGFQFDLVFKRADRVLTLFEIKYQKTELGISVANEFAARLETFPNQEQYQLQKVLVSAGPVSTSLKALQYFDRVIELDELLAGMEK